MLRKRFSTSLALIGLLGVVQIAAAGPFGIFGADACAEKVCKPVVETKKVTKRVYDDKCEDFCLPRCSFFSFFGGGCCEGGCPDHQCGKVFTKKALVVKLRTHDECVNKCVVEETCPTVCTAPCPAPCAAPVPMVVPPPLHHVGVSQPMAMPMAPAAR